MLGSAKERSRYSQPEEHFGTRRRLRGEKRKDALIGGELEHPGRRKEAIGGEFNGRGGEEAVVEREAFPLATNACPWRRKGNAG